MRDVLDTYLQSLESSPVRSLQEIVDFNKSYARMELPHGTSPSPPPPNPRNPGLT